MNKESGHSIKLCETYRYIKPLKKSLKKILFLGVDDFAEE